MTVEKVIWTALPNGIDDQGRLRISVHVAPRLRNDDGSDTQRDLGEFPAFVDWPERLNNFRFRVQFSSGLEGRGLPEAPADPNLWKLIFSPKTRVGPHIFQDHAKRDLHVFPVRPLLGFLEQAYGAVAAAGTNPPPIDDPFGPLAPFVPLSYIPQRINDTQSFYAELARAHQKVKTDGHVVFDQIADSSLSGSAQADQNNFFQAYRFYYRPGSQRPDFPQDYVEPSPKPHDFEFHEIVSSLADHPLLLRPLGLVIDMVIDVEAGLVPAQGSVRVIPDGDLPEDPPVCPSTNYDFDGSWFGARPASSFRMSHGVLRLSPEVFDLFQVDVDGAALQVVSFATTLEALKDPDKRSEASPRDATVPALRSAGLALSRQQRGDMLLEDLKGRRSKNVAIETGHPVAFDAEDLVRGYRVDVFDADAASGARWFSLHRRVADHAVKAPDGEQAPEPIKLTDEGYLKATTASGENAEHPTPSDDLYLHETIAGWDGWSLSAPRPGKRVVEPGEGDAGSSISRFDPEEGNTFPLVSRVGVEPGTLPRLRVGHRYRVRVRTVDLAGNSRPFSERELEPEESHLTSEDQAYLRFEPVPSPTVLRRHLDTEGESLEHLAIRSNLGVSPADYAELLEVKQALADANAPHVYREDSQRHLAPPKGSYQMAEQDSRFDTAFGGTPAQVTAALRVALREEGTFLDPMIVDLATGQKTVAQSTISLFPPGTSMPPQRGAGLPGGAYALYPDANVMLPYLPDPLAIGVSLTAFDFNGVEVFHLVAPFPDDWPAQTPFRVRLSEGPLGVALNAGVLEVQLPKAEVVWTRLASVFPENRLEDLAIWQWIPLQDRTASLRKAAVEGRHWMLTPYRQMIFSHAVQQPLVQPDMTKVISTRGLGDTFASFRGPILNHAKSTGRLDVYGEWTEDIDLITDDEPRMRAFGTEVAHLGQAFGFDIRRGDNAAEVALHLSRHEFGDTKYRRIVYHSLATTRFREFLPRPLTDAPANIQRVEDTLDAAAKLKPGLEHHVLSSARPAAPEVLYVLPTFRWERDDDGPIRRHVRHGKSVRVWLRRPWFSSGDGEQLGVILEPGVRLPPSWRRVAGFDLTAKDLAKRGPEISIQRLQPRVGNLPVEQPAAFRLSEGVVDLETNTLASELLNVAAVQAPTSEEVKRMLAPYVTGWGLDPVWRSALPEQPPTVAAFPRHSGYASGLTIEELPPSVAVVVAAHDVFYDRARKLWYCDIEVDPGETYFPFVRLALARYQAHSLTGAHLSHVVMTDFIQLAPDRTAEVSLAPGSAQITVSGYSGRNTLAEFSSINPFIDLNAVDPSRPNTTMRVSLERRIPGVPGDLGWERVGAEVPLHAAGSGFHVTWSGSIQIPEAEEGTHRLMITEVETYLRDLIPGDPMVSTSPLDFVRERIVYADSFAL